MAQVDEQIEVRVNSKNKELTNEEEKQGVPTTLDSYFINNKIAES
jgi:hypothetical protein